MTHLKLRVTVLLLVAASLVGAQAPPKQATALTSQQAAADFDQFWHEISRHYAYLSQKRIRWPQVRPGSAAAAASLQAGDQVLAVGGLPIADAVARELPRTLIQPNPRARDWALRRVLAGRRGQPRDISVRHADGCTDTVHLADEPGAPESTLLEARRIAGGIGYIRFHNFLGDSALVPEVDSALAEMKNAAALVLDLRDTPGGGDSAVAEPILGRFVDRTRGYQKFVVPVGSWRRTRSFVEKVRPRGPFTYGGKLVVLVGHWTASMGEGVAVGLAGIHRATVIGTPMAGLNGATYTRHLRFSGIPYNYPAERIYAVDGTPREVFQPDILVPLAGAASPDPILDCTLAVLRGASPATCKQRSGRTTCAEAVALPKLGVRDINRENVIHTLARQLGDNGK